jgi:uncharacterized protein YhfF
MDESKEQLIEEYWCSYLETLSPDEDNRPAKYEAWGFGNSPEMADKLGELVRAGIKTATASLGWWYEQEGEPYPKVGGYSVILDGQGRPMCIIKTTELTMCAFNEVDADHAYQEGEGDRSLAHWREVHWKFFSEECLELKREPDEKMPVLCEKFTLVYA